MRNLLDFLVKYSYWFLFFVLEAVSFVLLFQFNSYQGSVWFSSANAVAGKLYETTSAVESYFQLSKINTELTQRNLYLEQRLCKLEKEKSDSVADSTMENSLLLKSLQPYRLIPAQVVNMKWGRKDNLLTIDKGEVDARIIKEFEVVEGSVVLKGAVPGATVQTVKDDNNINKNKGDNNMPKNIEDLEKGMNQNTENIKKANEDLAAALKKNGELEDKINKANEEIENMGKALDEVMKKGVANPEIEEKKANAAFEKYLRTGNKEIEGLEKAAIGTGQATVLIPTILSHEILKEVKEVSNFLMKGKFYTGSGDYIKIPVRNEITGANQIVKEGQGNTQDGTLGYTHIELRAGYRQVRYPITDELVQDSAFDMVGELKEAISEEFGQTLSELTVKGPYNASTEQFIEGFLTNATVTGAAITTATVKKVTADDLVKLETGMKASYRKGSAYYVSPKLYEEMKLWKDGDGRYLWMNILEGATMKFNGYPVYVEEFLEDIDTGKYPAVFCDFGKGYAYYQKKGFEQELNRKVNERITEYYTRIRIGGGVIRPKAFSVLKVK